MLANQTVNGSAGTDELVLDANWLAGVPRTSQPRDPHDQRLVLPFAQTLDHASSGETLSMVNSDRQPNDHEGQFD
jgi:hypothetical protein